MKAMSPIRIPVDVQQDEWLKSLQEAGLPQDHSEFVRAPALMGPLEFRISQVRQAAEFLSNKLSESTTLYAVTLIDEAEGQGISRWALYKAKARMGIQHDKEGHFQGRTFWFRASGTDDIYRLRQPRPYCRHQPERP